MGLFEVHTENKYDPLIWSNEIPTAFNGIIIPGNAYSLKGDFGTMVFQEMPFREYALWLSHYGLKHSRRFVSGVNVSTIELNILISNNVAYHLTPMREIYLKETQFNITYSPFFENVVKFESGQVVSTMDFHFALSFLKRMAAYFPALLNPFINRILDGQFTTFFPRPLYATAQMLSACRDILLELNRPSPNYFAIDLLVQLLFVQAISCQRDFVRGSQVILNKDIDAIHHISNLILDDLSDIKRIEQLARVAGMNEKKLKGLFKQEFGTGIYEYWLRHRLQKAREMVLDYPLMSIQEIAYEFGYSSPQSFVKAFKKMFHNAPGKLRMWI